MIFFFALGRPVKQNYGINAIISDVLEPGSYFIKLFSTLSSISSKLGFTPIQFYKLATRKAVISLIIYQLWLDQMMT